MDRWQPVPLVAAALGIPTQTIYTWIRRGQIQSVHWAGVMHVDTAAVIDRRSGRTVAAA